MQQQNKELKEKPLFIKVPGDVYKKADKLRTDSGQTWKGFVTCLLRDHIVFMGKGKK